MSSVLQGLTAQRDAVLAEHIAAECAHDIERALKTFRVPHNYVFPLSLEAPGAEAVSGLLAAVFAAFPDFEFLSGTNPSRGRFSNRRGPDRRHPSRRMDRHTRLRQSGWTFPCAAFTTSTAPN